MSKSCSFAWNLRCTSMNSLWIKRGPLSRKVSRERLRRPSWTTRKRMRRFNGSRPSWPIKRLSLGKSMMKMIHCKTSFWSLRATTTIKKAHQRLQGAAKAWKNTSEARCSKQLTNLVTGAEALGMKTRSSMPKTTSSTCQQLSSSSSSLSWSLKSSFATNWPIWTKIRKTQTISTRSKSLNKESLSAETLSASWRSNSRKCLSASKAPNSRPTHLRNAAFPNLTPLQAQTTQRLTSLFLC